MIETFAGPAGRKSHLDEEGPLEAVVDDAIDAADHGRICVQDLLDAWGDRSYGPLFVIIGFVAATPISAIPPTAGIMGVVIAALALQMAVGKHHPWLPQFILRRSISAEKLEAARKKSAKLLDFFDRMLKERFTFAVSAPMRRVAALAVVLLGLSMLPFEMVPFAGAAPATAVVLFGVAILARDGLAMMIGLASFAGVVALGLMLIR